MRKRTHLPMTQVLRLVFVKDETKRSCFNCMFLCNIILTNYMILGKIQHTSSLIRAEKCLHKCVHALSLKDYLCCVPDDIHFFPSSKKTSKTTGIFQLITSIFTFSLFRDSLATLGNQKQCHQGGVL